MNWTESRHSTPAAMMSFSVHFRTVVIVAVLALGVLQVAASERAQSLGASQAEGDPAADRADEPMSPVSPMPPTRAARSIPPATLETTTRIVPLGLETNRMRGLNFDSHGTAWISVVEQDRRWVVRADPCSGEASMLRVMPEPSTDDLYMDNVLPVGEELFVCGGWYGGQVLFHPRTGQSRTLKLPVERPEIFNALQVDGQVLAFDGNHGILVWNTGDWTCELLPWPRPGKGPFAGVLVERERAIYCPMWWQNGMAETQPLYRLDLNDRTWTILTPPWPGTKPMGPVEFEGRLYMTDMFGGFMLVFDLESQSFIERVSLPGHGSVWQYAASFRRHGDLIDCSLSTYTGRPENNMSCDGRPHHFVNRRLMYAPRTGEGALISVPSLSGEGYVTVAYSEPRGDSLYLTCVDSPNENNWPKVHRGPAYLVELKVRRVQGPSQ